MTTNLGFSLFCYDIRKAQAKDFWKIFFFVFYTYLLTLLCQTSGSFLTVGGNGSQVTVRGKRLLDLANRVRNVPYLSHQFFFLVRFIGHFIITTITFIPSISRDNQYCLMSRAKLFSQEDPCDAVFVSLIHLCYASEQRQCL